MKNIQDNFSAHAAGYAQFRPVYPNGLYEFLYSQANGFDSAWDCATGNGQVAARLADKFDQVMATDISTKQIEHAVKKKNIEYSVERAEQTNFPDNYFDLVTVGQALHWFDFEAFNKEVVRVSKNGGLVAAWSYNLLKIDPKIDELINEFYFNTITGYWDKERKYVDDDYRDIPFPFEVIRTPPLSIGVSWNVDELEGYLGTWSGVLHFVRKEGYNPITALMQGIRPLWGEEGRKPVHFPLTVKLGRIIK